MFTLGPTKYKIRILYKSGNEHTFWCRSFSVQKKRANISEIKWTTMTPANTPIEIGVNNVESIWQVGARVNVWNWFMSVVHNLT